MPPAATPAPDFDLPEQCRRLTTEAIETAVKIMLDPTTPEASRIAAANLLLDRGHGRASQAVAVNISLPNSLKEMGEVELLSFIQAVANGEDCA